MWTKRLLLTGLLWAALLGSAGAAGYLAVPNGNASCTTVSSPYPCCTGAGTGTCLATGAIVTSQTPNRILVEFGLTSACTAANNPYNCCTGSAAGCVAGTNYPLYTAGPQGSRCTGLWVNSSDTATHAVNFQTVQASTDTAACTGAGVPFSCCTAATTGCYQTVKGPGTIVTTTASGSAGTFTVPQQVNSATSWPGLPPDSDGNGTIPLAPGDQLVANFATAIATSGDVIAFGGVCQDF